MKQAQFLLQLQAHIALHFKNPSAYAKHVGLSPRYVALVLHEDRPPTKRMVADLGMTEYKYTTRLYFKVS